MASKIIARKAAHFILPEPERSKLRRKPAMKKKKRPLHPIRQANEAYHNESESDSWTGYKSDSDLYATHEVITPMSIRTPQSEPQSRITHIVGPWTRDSEHRRPHDEDLLTITYSSSQNIHNSDAYCACSETSDSKESFDYSDSANIYDKMSTPSMNKNSKMSANLSQKLSGCSNQSVSKLKSIYGTTTKKAPPCNGVKLFFFDNEFQPQYSQSLDDLSSVREEDTLTDSASNDDFYIDAGNVYKDQDNFSLGEEPLYEEVGEHRNVKTDFCQCLHPKTGKVKEKKPQTHETNTKSSGVVDQGGDKQRMEETKEKKRSEGPNVKMNKKLQGNMHTSASAKTLTEIRKELEILLASKPARKLPVTSTVTSFRSLESLVETKDDDTTLAQTDGSGSGWSTYSSGKPDTESMYAEPIYNNSNGSGSGSGGSIYGTKSSIPSPSGHQKPWSPGSSSSTSFNDDSHYNDSIWSFDQSSSAYSSYGPSSGNFRDVVTKPGSARSVNGVSFNSSPFNGDKTLPPLPPGQSPFAGIRNVEMQTKFSSIAKTAGRKLAKKLFSMRRTSRSGGSDSPVERRVSSPEMTPCPQTKLKSYRGSLGDLSQPNGHLTSAKRSISRPNIPPPEPPSPPVVTLPPNGPPKVPLPPLPTQTVSINNVRSTSGVPLGNNQKATVTQEDQTNNHKNVYSNSNYYSPQSRRDSQSLSNSSENGPAQKSQEIHRSLSVPANGGDDFDDDYDDSDFYDSDSELIRNFVSAVQPIYSMEEEPLYQYYTYGISLKPEDDYQPVIPKNLGLTLDMLVPRVGQRTLWCELPEVMSSGILAILSDKQKQLQEAIFEILTSEVSYLKSLDVLISLFYESPELNAVLNQDEIKFIYGNITEVKECCQSFLSVLLKKWEESWYIQEIGEVINEYTMTKFLVYKEYCRNKPYQDRTLQRLRITNEDFVSIVKRIEENPKCQMLRMDSFLMLPMQRITRLPLLVNAVIQRTTSLKEKATCEEALKNLTNLVIDCNEAARESQDAEETATIMDKLEFPRGARSPVLGQLLLKGDFIKNPFDSSGKTGNNGQLNWTFRKSKRTVYTLILFSNYLLVAKKKSSGKYEVLDMVPSKDSAIKPLPNIEGGCKDFQHFFMLHFALKDTVYFLGARSQSEIEKWKKKFESLRPATKSPQSFEVLAIFPYQAQLEDELSFQPGDRILVTQTQPDGWYYGKKLTIYDTKETKSGWFPGNYCES